MSKLKILFLGVNPNSTEHLQESFTIPKKYHEISPETHSNAIESAARYSLHTQVIEVHAKLGVRRKDVVGYLNEYQPDVVIFCSHGEKSGDLVVHEDNFEPGIITPGELQEILANLPVRVRLLVLIAIQ